MEQGGRKMEDTEIVNLYWKREERAVEETAKKYGNYCYSIAYNILSNHEDSEESVNDTYIETWNAIPPSRPLVLSSFLGKITRRIAIDKWRSAHAQKRGGGEIADVLDELEECIAYEDSAERHLEKQMLAQTINDFLGTLSASERKIFVCRYFYMDSVESVCKRLGYSESKVKSVLFRIREKLRRYLQKEGFQ
jgi:RNA polymerase sigma-70 factor (ECF subfamily)